MEKPRILFVSEAPIDDAIPNGVLTSVKRSLEHLRSQEYDVKVVCPRTENVPKQYAGYPITTVGSVMVQGFPAGVGGSNKIPKLVRKFSPDVVYSASPFAPMSEFAITAASSRGIPIVCNYQTDIPGYADDQGKSIIERYQGITKPDNRGYYALPMQVIRRLSLSALHTVGLGHRPKRLAARRVASLHNQAVINLAPSRSAQDQLIEYGVNQETIRIWGRGVDTVLYSPMRRTNDEVTALREHILRGRDIPIGGYVGRIAPEKGLESLEDIIDLDFQMVLIGDGPSMPEIRKRLGDRALFLGKMNGVELANAYSAFDFFVHTGKKETFGQTIQESKASGTPPIAPAIGGPLDTIEHGETGLLYDPRDDKDLRKQVEILLEYPALRQELGRRARLSVESRSWFSLGQQLEQHFADAVALRNP